MLVHQIITVVVFQFPGNHCFCIGVVDVDSAGHARVEAPYCPDYVYAIQFAV
jgi:hypothetical protein